VGLRVIKANWAGTAVWSHVHTLVQFRPLMGKVAELVHD